MSGLYDGFEQYRVPSRNEIKAALNSGIISLDANVLLNFYRYNDDTVDTLLGLVEQTGDRLFISHQALREFWRNRQTVLDELGGSAKEARSAIEKNARSTSDAVSRWAKSVALSEANRRPLLEEVRALFDDLSKKVTDKPVAVRAATPTSKDPLLARLDGALAGRVGAPLSDEDWVAAVTEGERRVLNKIPPGYLDEDKLESDLPERASGDYIVWKQLMIEGASRGRDLVFVTADVKEDWWNRADRGSIVGPRHELVGEYLRATGRRLYLLEPTDLIRQLTPDSDGERAQLLLEDIERVRAEDPTGGRWDPASVEAVLTQLDANGYSQADVIREAVRSGGRITRDRVYAIDGRSTDLTLNGFTKPVRRITGQLQSGGLVPPGVAPLLRAVYEVGVEATHFAVPPEVVESAGTRPIAAVPHRDGSSPAGDGAVSDDDQ